MPRNKTIDEKLSVLPRSPGVYLMKNAAGSIIYVGKSKCLKNRVTSYFQSPAGLNSKTRKLVSNIADFEIIVTQSEAEALLLENELIKKHYPKYNIKLKDSKSYPYIKKTREAYPRLVVQYERKDDKCKYYGPYTSASSAYDIIKTLQKVFRLPNCERKIEYGKAVGRPCLNYHIDQCIAPCTGKISEEEYADIFDEIEMVLKGNYQMAEKSLEKKMYLASEQMRFETAAKYRDSIKNLKNLTTRQKIKSSPDMQKDVFGFYETDTHSAIAVLLVRDGIVIDKNIIHMNQDEICDDEALCDLMLRYYHNPDTIPKEISLSFEINEEDLKDLTRILSEKCGHSVNVHTPQKGVGKELCSMAADNAKEAIIIREKQEENDSSLLIRLAGTLGLEVVPEKIESYDISNNGDKDMYCGMIVVENGKFKKSAYRSFSIKTTDGIDDYGAMREALSRRFSHIGGEDDKSSMSVAPDLILLDGGVGHVSTVKQLAGEMNIDIPIFGMVKDQFHKTRTITDGENEISIAKDSVIFSFIYKIQEEVHRYTFSKMDASRRKKMKTLAITEVKGIGQAKAKAIYEKFKTPENLKNATVEELCQVRGITEETAARLIEFLREEQ